MEDSSSQVPITTLVGPSGKRGTKAILSEETGTITVAVEGDEYVKVRGWTD